MSPSTTDSLKSPAPLTHSLSSDIVLLSSYLSGRKVSSLEVHIMEEDLALFVDISTLLAAGGNQAYAVMGNSSTTAVEFLVFSEPKAAAVVKPHSECSRVEVLSSITTTENVAGVQDEICSELTESLDNDKKIEERFRESADEVGHLVRITPLKENGQKLLSRWDSEKLDETPDLEDVVERIKDSELDRHLHNLFDVIIALNRDDGDDLFQFQMFIHHRAYQKLGYRVLEFMTHWGTLPFDILSKNLNPNLEKKPVYFKCKDPQFHDLIQDYVTPEPVTASNSGPSYSVNVTNAPQWLKALKAVWVKLQSHVLVQRSEEGGGDVWVVREDTPSPRRVNDIVAILFVLDALMPVWKHLLSNLDLCATHALGLAELEARQDYVSRIKKSLGSNSRSLIDAKLLGGHDERDLELVVDTDCESLVFISRCLDSQVHPEAALMTWIATSKDMDSRQSWPIGVNTKSCHLCWLLHEIFNRGRSSKFVLRGSHGTFLPWVPPPGLPDSILLELRNALLSACVRPYDYY